MNVAVDFEYTKRQIILLAKVNNVYRTCFFYCAFLLNYIYIYCSKTDLIHNNFMFLSVFFLREMLIIVLFFLYVNLGGGNNWYSIRLQRKEGWIKLRNLYFYSYMQNYLFIISTWTYNFTYINTFFCNFIPIVCIYTHILIRRPIIC
jgi:hypothetical protein